MVRPAPRFIRILRVPLIAKNDYLIDEILKSDKHRIDKDGTCWIVDRVTKKWRRWDRNSRKHSGKNKPFYKEVSFRTKSISVHRIVYAKFVGKLNKHLTINHIDGNPSNNRPENLELVTMQENARHSWSALKRKPVISNNKIDKEIALMIRQQRRLGANYKELCEMFGLCKSTISYVINERTWNWCGVS